MHHDFYEIQRQETTRRVMSGKIKASSAASILSQLDKAERLGVELDLTKEIMADTGATIGPISHTPGIECWCKSCELIAFFAARLVEVYGESPNLDYIHLARRITGHEIGGQRKTR